VPRKSVTVGAFIGVIITTPVGYVVGAAIAQLPYVASMGNSEAAQAGGIKGAIVGLI
jgi:hypothetical protein